LPREPGQADRQHDERQPRDQALGDGDGRSCKLGAGPVMQHDQAGDEAGAGDGADQTGHRDGATYSGA